MQTCPHINFPGTCEEALLFYEQTIGARIQYLLRYQDTPMKEQVPTEFGNKIIHATLSVGNSTIMAADAPPEHYRPPQGIALTLESSDLAEAEKAFQALAQSGKINMPFQKTFWSPGFGTLTDKFDIPWMVSTSQLQS